MKRIIFPTAMAILSGFVGAVILFAQQQGSGQDQMMQLMMKYGSPGEFHKKLEPMIGSWDMTAKFWMDPKGMPQESKGTSECKWIMDGRYVEEDDSGDMMGMPFHGRGVYGYDNFRQEYVSTWLDNMSTTFMTMKGMPDKDGKTITYQGNADDIMTGQKDKKFKVVTKFIDNDHRVYQSFDTTPDGKEFMAMEVSYTRKK